MQIDLPEVKAEVEAAFAAYEEALVTNDVPTLEALFWDDGRTIRYGMGENLYGMEAIRAFRRARSPSGLSRSLDRTVITTFGRDSLPPPPCSGATACLAGRDGRCRAGPGCRRDGAWSPPM